MRRALSSVRTVRPHAVEQALALRKGEPSHYARGGAEGNVRRARAPGRQTIRRFALPTGASARLSPFAPHDKLAGNAPAKTPPQGWRWFEPTGLNAAS